MKLLSKIVLGSFFCTLSNYAFSYDLTKAQDLCNDGDKFACLELSSFYHNRDNLGLSLINAQKACDLKSVAGCTILAHLYQTNDTIKNDEIALGYYKKSCEEKNSKSCSYLGDYYLNIYNENITLNEPSTNQDASLVSNDGLPPETTKENTQTNTKPQTKLSNEDLREVFFEAFKYYKFGCDAGSAKSCIQVANFYEKGIGVKNDLKLSLYYYREAANFPNNFEGPDLHKTHVFYDDENGEFKKNFKSLYKESKKECEQGDAISCGNYALMFNKSLNGALTMDDMATSEKLLTKACNLGDGASCLELAGLHPIIGAPRCYSSYVDEANLFKKACDANVGEGCYRAGVYYSYKWDQALVKSEVLPLYKKACDLNQKFACLEIAKIYKEGNGVTQDYKKANEYFYKACNLGDTTSCEEYAINKSEGKGSLLDKLQAKKILTRITANQKSSANTKLGLLLLELDGNKANINEVYKLFDEGCQGYDIEGCKLLAKAYKTGDKVKKDLKKSKAYLEKACDLTDDEACKILNKPNNKDAPWFKLMERKCDDTQGSKGCRFLFSIGLFIK